MRPPTAVPAAALVAMSFAAVPAVASAAPHPVRDRALTIHATPRSIIAGEQVLITGRLHGRDVADQTVQLWHRIVPASSFTVISTTKTDSDGRYEFIRADGIVNTNRNWFVRGPVNSHSKTIHERVAAEVSLVASGLGGTTRHPLTFSGRVTPDHTGEPIALQVQRGPGDDWTTVKRARIGADSNYSIAYAWRTPGPRNVRTVFAGDPRNTPGASSPVTVVIQQREAPYATIDSSNPIAPSGTATTIGGTFDEPHTSTPEANTPIELYAAAPGSHSFAVVQNGMTAGNGGYQFTVEGTTNELYQVRTTGTPAQSTAVVFQGVQDALTMSANPAGSTVNGTVTFSGSVAPDKTGEPIYLQKLGRDGQWQTVRIGQVSTGSQYSFSWTFGTSGAKQFRARILGDGTNVGGASPAVSVPVAEPPLAALPTS